MLKIVTVSTLMFLPSLIAIGQTSNKEQTKLREHLNLPQSTKIIQSDSITLPTGNTLKIYFAFGQDKKTYKRFTKWIDEWNQQEGSKYGKLEIVSALSDADLILARFYINESVPRQRSTISVGPMHDPTKARNATSPKTSSRLYMPTAEYSYLITRTPESLVVLYDDVDRTHISEHSDPDKYLFNELKEKLRNR